MTQESSVASRSASPPRDGSQEKRRQEAPSDGASISSTAPETELRQTLKERHVNMIGFSMVLGVYVAAASFTHLSLKRADHLFSGLFLSSGKAIFLAGPGAAVIAYLLMLTLMWSVMATMAEMTALFPVKGAMFEFPRRFIDESVGYAAAWMMWYE
jgi:yeast amino acid transporter